MVPRVDLDLFVHINRMNSAIFFWRFCILAAISSRQQHRHNRQPMLFASAIGPPFGRRLTRFDRPDVARCVDG